MNTENEDLSPQEGSPQSQTPESGRRPGTFDAAFDWIELFMIYFSVGVLLILCFFRHTPVIGTSMLQTLKEDDILIISTFAYTPKQGDIVVCQSEIYGLERPLVKRVIATAGQTVSINYETWGVTVDGVTLDEPYVNYVSGVPMRPSDYLSDTFTVPEGKVFVMGDNRNYSADSRSSAVGLIDERYILGKVKLKIYPFSDFEYFS